MEAKKSELTALVKSYIKNWKLFVLSFVICVGVAGVYILVKNPEYRVAANILIKEDSKSGGMSGLASSMMKGMAFGDMLSVGGSAVDDELEVISSYSIIFQAVKELGLNVNYSEGLIKKKNYYKDAPILVSPVEPMMADTFRRHVRFEIEVNKNQEVEVEAFYKRDKLAKVKSGFPVKVSTMYGDFTIDKTQFFKEGKSLDMSVYFTGYSSFTQGLMKNLDISIASKKANVINLLYEDEIPGRGIDLLNTIVAKYNAYGIDEKNLTAERTAVFLQQRIDLLDKNLKDIEHTIESYKETNNLTDIESEARIILEKSNDFKEQLIKAETNFAVISMIEDFLKDPANKYAVVPMSLGIDEKSAVESLLAYNTLLMERLKLLRSTNPGNPMIETMNEQVDATRESVIVTIQSIKRGIEYARNDLKMQEETFMNRIKGMPKQEREYIEIKRQQEIKQALYLYLLQQQEENALKLAQSNPKAQIIDKAYMYNIPVKPMKKLVALAALLFAVMLPIAYLYVRKRFNSKFESKNSLDGLDVYVAQDLHSSDKKVLFNGKETQAEEDFRLLRSSVMLMLDNDFDGKSLLVSSINDGEGKSFVALNMALSVAKLGKKVLLVDADLRKAGGSLSSDSEFCSHSGAGICDVVKGSSSLASVIRTSSYDSNLDFLPSGSTCELAPETLLNKRFGQIIEECRKTYDFIIFDSAYLLDYSDTMALFNMVDSTLFVTRANYSDVHVFGYIETLVETNKIEKYLCVVNDVKKEKR